MDVIARMRLGDNPKAIEKASKPMTTARAACKLRARSGEFESEWFDLLGFGRQAEQLLAHRKGDEIFVHGRLQTNEYTNASGESIRSLQIVASSIVSGAALSQRFAESKEPAEPTADPEPDFDDRIPF